jgi:hypothetical protein
MAAREVTHKNSPVQQIDIPQGTCLGTPPPEPPNTICWELRLAHGSSRRPRTTLPTTLWALPPHCTSSPIASSPPTRQGTLATAVGLQARSTPLGSATPLHTRAPTAPTSSRAKVLCAHCAVNWCITTMWGAVRPASHAIMMPVSPGTLCTCRPPPSPADKHSKPRRPPRRGACRRQGVGAGAQGRVTRPKDGYLGAHRRCDPTCPPPAGGLCALTPPSVLCCRSGLRAASVVQITPSSASALISWTDIPSNSPYT